nr:DUF4440 domain-containing protein [Vibrio sp. S9_S30]
MIEQERALHAHSVRSNRDELKRLLHPDFVEVGKAGVTYYFEDVLEERSVDVPPEIHAQEFLCVELKSSLRLLLYKTAVQDQQGGYFDYTKRSSIWTLTTDESWQLIYHQGTLCSEFEIKE